MIFLNPSVWNRECLHIELRIRSSQISRGLLGVEKGKRGAYRQKAATVLPDRTAAT